MKLNQISIKSVWILSFLALLSIASFMIAEKFKIYEKDKWYDAKLAASKLAENARIYLKNFRLQNAVFIDNVNDPNETGIIGQKYSPITTDRGLLTAKLSTTNPNFAAVVVDLLKKADLKKGDKIAIALTGSLPALNIATIAAVQALGLDPIIISSIGSSNWGANDPEFTWLDMEKILFDAGIFTRRSIAASMGGGSDIGRGLSPEGRKMLKESVERNQVPLIYDEALTNNIDRRMVMYDKASNGLIKAYINVGGGIASLGSSLNGDMIPTGLSLQLPKKNYPIHGTMIKMANRGIPIIHLQNLASLMKEYHLENNPYPLPVPGEGSLYFILKYNYFLVLSLAGFLVCIIGFVVYFDRKNNKLGSEIINEKEKIYIEEL
jgi:poly-gamma-glutamate system protein